MQCKFLWTVETVIAVISFWKNTLINLLSSENILPDRVWTCDWQIFTFCLLAVLKQTAEITLDTLPSKGGLCQVIKSWLLVPCGSLKNLNIKSPTKVANFTCHSLEESGLPDNNLFLKYVIHAYFWENIYRVRKRASITRANSRWKS